MKDLGSHGVGSSKRQAEPISEEEENRLCELGLLGNLNAQTLLDTMIWMCASYFALHSGWSIGTFVLTSMNHLFHTFCTQKMHRKITREDWKIAPKQVTCALCQC